MKEQHLGYPFVRGTRNSLVLGAGKGQGDERTGSTNCPEEGHTLRGSGFKLSSRNRTTHVLAKTKKPKIRHFCESFFPHRVKNGGGLRLWGPRFAQKMQKCFGRSLRPDPKTISLLAESRTPISLPPHARDQQQISLPRPKEEKGGGRSEGR